MRETSSSEPTPLVSHKPLKGILILLGAVVCFAIMDASAKWLTRDLRALQIAGVRYLVSLFVVAAFVNPWRQPGVLKTHKFGLPVRAGPVSCSGNTGLLFGAAFSAADPSHLH